MELKPEEEKIKILENMIAIRNRQIMKTRQKQTLDLFNGNIIDSSQILGAKIIIKFIDRKKKLMEKRLKKKSTMKTMLAKQLSMKTNKRKMRQKTTVSPKTKALDIDLNPTDKKLEVVDTKGKRNSIGLDDQIEVKNFKKEEAKKPGPPDRNIVIKNDN